MLAKQHEKMLNDVRMTAVVQSTDNADVAAKMKLMQFASTVQDNMPQNAGGGIDKVLGAVSKAVDSSSGSNAARLGFVDEEQSTWREEEAEKKRKREEEEKKERKEKKRKRKDRIKRAMENQGLTKQAAKSLVMSLETDSEESSEDEDAGAN